MRRARKSEPVDPNPHMLRGETDFEEKRIECEFELVYSQISKSSFETFKAGCEQIFRKGYFTGKAAGIREQKDRS